MRTHTTNKRLLLTSILLLGSTFGLIQTTTTAEAVETCQNYDRSKGRLWAEVDLKEGKTKIHNESDKCAYNVGVASFKMMDKNGNEQELYDVKYGVIKKNDTLTLNIQVPNCAYQFDTFVTKTAEQLSPREGIDHVNDGRRNTNKPVCKENKPEPTATPTGIPTAIPTRTPTMPATPTPTSVPTAIPTAQPTISPVQSQTQTQHQEQTVNIQNEKVVEYKTTEQVITTTKGGQTVYQPQAVTKTPDTGAEMLAYLAMIPSTIGGVILRKKSH